MAFAYLLLLDDEHLEAIESSETSLPSRSKIATELVGRVLAKLFRLRVKDYPTSIEEDEIMLGAGHVSPRTTMAIKVRIGEKQVLKEAISTALTFTGGNRKMRTMPQPDSNNVQKRKLEDQSQTKKKARHRRT